jgi:hypothetical protein
MGHVTVHDELVTNAIELVVPDVEAGLQPLRAVAVDRPSF